jgi:hypothetical protein
LAEREGFEPSVEFPLHTLSKRARSTTPTSLRFRINDLRSVGNSVAQNPPSRIFRFDILRDVNRLAGRTRDHRTRIVSDLLMSFDHLRRSCSGSGRFSIRRDGDARQLALVPESPCRHPRELRELAGERSEERNDKPDLFGGEVATDLVSAHHEHCLVKGGARSCASSMKVAL